MDKKNDINERLLEFKAGVNEFLKTIPNSPENITIQTQLSKSIISLGSISEKSQTELSKNDFTNDVKLLRRIRESHYWLRIIKQKLKDPNRPDLDDLIKESCELQNILGSTVQKSQ